MTEPNFRLDRITKLLHELQYEVTRGMLEREINEEISFEFCVPISQKIPRGVVYCRFHTQPVPHHVVFSPLEPKLKLVKGGE